MAIAIKKSFLSDLGFDLDKSVSAYTSAMEAHAQTVNVPAPTTDPLTEAVYRSGGYTIDDDTPPVSIPEPQRPMLPKSTVQSRVIDAGKMKDAYNMLTANPDAFARWFAPDWPQVYCDDPDAINFVKALGLDPTVILAPLKKTA